MGAESNKNLLYKYAKSFNNLDISYVKDSLAESFHYNSQWVFDEIKSKKEYLKYFEAKLSAIKDSDTKIIAQLGVYNSEYCIVIYQIDLSKRNKKKTASLIIETDFNKITRANMCIIPTINEIQLLEIIPV